MSTISKVIVVGSINMDIVAVGDRHPRPGETVSGRELHLLPGGKGANQAVAACRGGAVTHMVGRLGDDAFAGELREFLRLEGIDLDQVNTVKGSSGTALIMVAGGENTIVVVKGANDRLAPADVLNLPIVSGDVVLAQFEVPPATIAAAFEIARARGASTILNPAPAEVCDARLLELTDLLLVNESELCTLLGLPAVNEMSPAAAVDAAHELRDGAEQVVVVTLGAAGAVALAGDQVIEIEGHRVDVVDTTGAGDCFAGNLAAELGRGSNLEKAMRTANRAASLCVQKLGAGVSMPYSDLMLEVL
jgi:ribokinase